MVYGVKTFTQVNHTYQGNPPAVDSREHVIGDSYQHGLCRMAETETVPVRSVSSAGSAITLGPTNTKTPSAPPIKTEA